MLLSSSDTERTLMHLLLFIVYKFRPERTGFNMYTEYTQPQLTFLALHPCSILNICSALYCTMAFRLTSKFPGIYKCLKFLNNEFKRIKIV